MTQQRKSRSDRKPIYPYTSLPIENVICVWYNFLRITLHMHLIIHTEHRKDILRPVSVDFKGYFFIHKDTVFGNVQLLCCIIFIFSLERNDHWISHNASEERLRQLFKIDTIVSCYNNNKGCSLSTMIHYSSIFIPVIDCIDNNNCKVTTVIS